MIKDTLHKPIVLLVIHLLIFAILSCKKTDAAPEPSPVIPVPGPVSDTIPKDPSTDASIGFFMDKWVEKVFSVPTSTTENPIASEEATVTITINAGQVITKIAPVYFGNNTNPFIGQIGDEAKLVSHLTNFAPRIIRAPGGSLSDVYFFNALKDQPPADVPDTLLNADGTKYKNYYWFGKNTESWTQSVDNYYSLLQKTNSKGMITVNYGYARYGTGANPVQTAAHYAADWVRYDKGRTEYWEIGNESAGSWEAGYRIDVSKNKDGQPEFISGEIYGKHFKVFTDSMRKAAAEVGNNIRIGAQLVQTNKTYNTIDQNWNSGYFAQAGNAADFYIVHSYFTPYHENSTVQTIMNSAVSEPQDMMNWMKATTAAGGVSMKPIALTEWNLFASGSMQNVSHIAGLHAVETVGELIKNKFGAALRWDLANGWENGDDHGLFSFGDEPGVAKWNPRPTFYHMYYFQRYSGDRMLSSTVAGSTDIAAYASSFSSGQKGVILLNKGSKALTAEIRFQYFTPGDKFYYYLLNGDMDNGSFSRKVLINGTGPENGIAGGPASYQNIAIYSTTTTNGIKVTLPALSVVFLVTDKK